MALRIYSHPDGGHYVIEDNRYFDIKMEDGSWREAVLYRPVHRLDGGKGRWSYLGRRRFGTTKARWAERFTDTGETTAHFL